MKKDDLIQIMLKKYNCSDIEKVEKLDLNFAGALCNSDIKIVFDIKRDIKNSKRILLIQG